MDNSLLSEALKLDTKDRIRLVGDIWDSIAACPGPIELTDQQREELERRLASHEMEPESGSPWPEVKQRIQSGR